MYPQEKIEYGYHVRSAASLHLKPNEEPSSLESNSKVRLGRYIIDILAFTYDVDFDALDDALSNTPFGSRHARDPSVTSILPSHEREALLGLSKIVDDARGKVHRQEMAFVSSGRWNLMYQEIVLPSIGLQVPPTLALDKIHFYLDHQNDPTKRNRTIFYFKPFNWRKPSTWFKPSIWLGYYSPDALAECLVSDEILCQIIAPNEKARLIITDAIAVARSKYVPLQSQAASIPRTHYGTLLSSQLFEQIKTKVENNARNTEYFVQQRTASEIFPLGDQLWNLLCAHRGFPSRIPNGTPTSYEVLLRNMEANSSPQPNITYIPS